MNTVVIIHGVTFHPGRLAYMAGYLRRRGFKVLYPSLLPSNGSAAIEQLAADLRSYIDVHTSPDERIDLIGFSMGGLIARYYLQFLGGAQRTDRLITIATPHLGTRITYLFPGHGMKQMRPNSAFLQNLNKDLSPLKSISCTSIYTPLDGIILPASSSIFHHSAAAVPRFQIIRHLIPAHPLMIYHPKIMKSLVMLLRIAGRSEEKPPKDPH